MALDLGLIYKMLQERGEQVPQASDPGARRRLAEAEALRQRRLRQDQVNAELAQRKLEAVQRMSPEAARQRRAEVMADPARPGNSPVMEPHDSYATFYGDRAVGPTRTREAAYDVLGQYQNQLKGAVEWNKAVNEYSLPLPMKTVDPEKLHPYRGAARPDPWYSADHGEVDPENSIHMMGTVWGENRDEYGQKLRSPIRSKRPSFQTENYGPVYQAAENPFQLTPSPYSLSQFGQAMQRRFR